MTDSVILFWIEKNKAHIKYREYLPDNKRTDKPWWVCADGHNPFTGVTLREAVKAAAYAQRIVERQERKNDEWQDPALQLERRAEVDLG